MNKKLSAKPPDIYSDASDMASITMWWDSFVNDFFDDHARLTIRNVSDEHNQIKNYTISRTLIPRFFRSFGEGGVTDMYFHLVRSQTAIPKDIQTQPQSIITFESDSCTMITKHGRPMFAKICTEGHLYVEFLLNNVQLNESFASNEPHQAAYTHPHPPVRIRNWVFSIRRFSEMIPRSAIAIQQDPNLIEQLSKNISKSGLTPATLHYLKLCNVLEPMQELMFRNKQTGVSPRECLKATVSQKMSLRMGGMGGAPPPPQPPPQFQRSGSMIGQGGIMEDLNKSEGKMQMAGSSSANASPQSQSGAQTPGIFCVLFFFSYRKQVFFCCCNQGVLSDELVKKIFFFVKIFEFWVELKMIFF